MNETILHQYQKIPSMSYVTIVASLHYVTYRNVMLTVFNTQQYHHTFLITIRKKKPFPLRSNSLQYPGVLTAKVLQQRVKMIPPTLHLFCNFPGNGQCILGKRTFYSSYFYSSITYFKAFESFKNF